MCQAADVETSINILPSQPPEPWCTHRKAQRARESRAEKGREGGRDGEKHGSDRKEKEKERGRGKRENKNGSKRQPESNRVTEKEL